MVSEDDLRDRIEYVLHRTAGADWHETAQAIIDEFGMTVETDFDPTTGRIGYDGRYEWTGKMARVVGKWEQI